MAFQGRRALGILLALCGLFALAGAPSSASGAEFGIVPGSFQVRMLDAEGNPEDRAGSHPDRMQFDFALTVAETGTTPRDFVFELPPGFAGDPSAVPQCPRQAFDEGEECPPETQVGTSRFLSSGGLEVELPIFELTPEPGQLAAFGSDPDLGVPFSMELRPDDFGITVEASNPSQADLSEGHIELWGVPADRQKGTTIPRRPLLTAPTRCGPVSLTLRTRSWQEGAPWLSASADTGAPLTGCASLAFDPDFDLQLSNPVADSPTGLRMELSTAGESEGSELAPAQIEDVTVELPDGIAVSPGGAEGLTACSDAQFGVGSASDVLCPASSKVGTVEIFSSALSGTLTGSVYLGEERPGERFRLFIVAPGPGFETKFVGVLSADLATGRLSSTLRDLPPLPIDRLSLNFDGGPGALLASPLTCGSVAAVSRFVPYGGGAVVDSTATVAISGRQPGAQCSGAAPFAPKLVTRSSNTKAGAPTSFTAELRRDEGEQLPRRFSVTLPAGLSATLGALPVCSPASGIASSCPAESRIGSVLVEIGSGPDLATLPGDVYLTDANARAPFALLLDFDAAVGPFDLGTMTLRAEAQVNRRNGRVSISTGSLPESIEGFPVRIRTIALGMDRAGLVRNPTSCAPASTGATIESRSGAVINPTSELALTGCHRLGFRPSVQISLASRAGSQGEIEPSLRLSTHLRKRDANLRAMSVSLPPLLKLDMSELSEICSRQDAATGRCPDRSRVGSASARTPLLSRPLKGSIYFVQPEGNGLPDIWTSMEAMGVEVDMRGRTSRADGHFVTRFSGLPDMPLSALTMHLGGSEKGLLALAATPCIDGHPRRFIATVATKGQNGRSRTLRPGTTMNVHCRQPSRSPGRTDERPTQARFQPR